jgi:hypothetical protein
MSRHILDGCIRKPATYNPNYPPAERGGKPYTVVEGDSFLTIAEKHAAGYRLSTQGLAKLILRHNFGTANPEEINFYLQSNMKCTRLTRDRANYMFTPGQTIFLPPLATAATKALESTGLWFGIGIKGGGVLVGGSETHYATMHALEAPLKRRFILEIGAGSEQLNRLALGVGASVGLTLVMVASLFDDPASDLNGLPVGGDWDLNVSLGGKWSDVVKGAKVAPIAKRVAEIVGKVKYVGEKVVNLGPQKVETIANAIKEGLTNGSLGVKTNAYSPQIVVFGLPGVGTGLEVSLGKSWGYAHVYDYVDETGVVWMRPRRVLAP